MNKEKIKEVLEEEIKKVDLRELALGCPEIINYEENNEKKALHSKYLPLFLKGLYVRQLKEAEKEFLTKPLKRLILGATAVYLLTVPNYVTERANVKSLEDRVQIKNIEFISNPHTSSIFGIGLFSLFGTYLRYRKGKNDIGKEIADIYYNPEINPEDRFPNVITIDRYNKPR